jgi:uncharacterized protein (TIGR02118 family)
MIVRSGLIKRVEHISEADFRRHWIEVHGPLALKLPHLRGYAQNLVTHWGPAGAAERLHRVDGVSQLWFDDVDRMVTGMNSPENDACVVDIGRFLAKVTLAVQRAGGWQGAPPATRQFKLMAIFVDDARFERVAAAISGSLAACAVRPLLWRVNPMAAGSFIVDPTVAHDEAALVAVLEAFFMDAESRDIFMGDAVLDRTGFAPAAVMAVSEKVLLPPPASF